MSNRRFEMYEYRAVLVRMRQGDSDRAIARSGLMGRSKVRRFRALADFHGWLESGNPCRGKRRSCGWRRSAVVRKVQGARQ